MEHLLRQKLKEEIIANGKINTHDYNIVNLENNYNFYFCPTKYNCLKNSEYFCETSYAFILSVAERCEKCWKLALNNPANLRLLRNEKSKSLENP